MATISIDDKAKPLLKEMADANGVSQKQFVELLINYAYSIHRRPGSWEASVPFDADTYTRPDTVADRWF